MKRDYAISILIGGKWKEVAVFGGASNKAALGRFLQNLNMRRQFGISTLGELRETRRPVTGRKIYDYDNYSFCVEIAL